jgi:hypothetical protein
VLPRAVLDDAVVVDDAREGLQEGGGADERQPRGVARPRLAQFDRAQGWSL